MKKIILLSFSFLASIFFACDNSLSLITDWKETTIVYAFLDSGDSITYIKVNKAFLGNDNVFSMAKIRDSSEYQNITVTLEKYLNNELIKTFDFEQTEVDHKEEGVFYSPYQTVYAAVTYNELDAIYKRDTSYTYKVKIINDSGEEVSTTIPLIDERMNLRKPQRSICFYDNDTSFTAIEWDTVTNGYLYKIAGEFEFLEVFDNGDTISRVVCWDRIYTSTNFKKTSRQIEVNVQNIKFFNMLLDKVPYSDKTKEKSVLRRRIGDFTLVFKIADKVFYDYNASSSIAGLNQDIPNFSNVDNGLGLVASRTTHKFTLDLHGSAKTALLGDSKYTHLKFYPFR